MRGRDGRIRAVLPTEIGSELVTALELAMDRDGSAPPRFEHPSSSRAVPDESEEGSGPAADHSIADRSDVERAAEVTTEAALEQRRADALHGLARTFLASEPDDRSGEDRHLVIVQVSAEALAQNVPAGTPRPSAHDVPAGTTPRCGVLGAGPLEVTTAERLACTGQVSLVLTDAGERCSTWAGSSVWPPAPSVVPCAFATPPAHSPDATRRGISTPTISSPGPRAA